MRVGLQALGQFADVRPFTSGEALDLQQQQVLQVGDAMAAGQQFGKAQEATQLVAEVGQRLELGFLEG